MSEQTPLSKTDILLQRLTWLIEAQSHCFYTSDQEAANRRGLLNTQKALLGLGYAPQALQEIENRIRDNVAATRMARTFS